MAGGRRGCAVSLRSGRAAFIGLPDLSFAHSLLLSVDLAGRRDAIYLDHLAHFLSLRLLPAQPVGPDPSLLDQHGSCGHLRAGRNDANHRCSWLNPADGPASISQRFYPAVLGDGDVVGPDARDFGRVAAYLPPVSTPVRSTVL